MNKYPIPDLITRTICGLFICTCNQVLAIDPNYKKTDMETNQGYQQDLMERYFTPIMKQFGGSMKNIVPDKGLINSSGKADENQITKLINSVPIKDEQINKSLGFFKGLVYDPNKPGPFFDNMINLQTISVSVQKQMIELSEKTLGTRNSYVIGLQENYKRSVRDLETLKQQKLFLQSAIPTFHK